MSKLLGALGGRKFLLALFAALAVALKERFGFSEDTVMTIGGVVAAYVLGQGFADGLSGGATSTTAASNAKDAPDASKN